MFGILRKFAENYTKLQNRAKITQKLRENTITDNSQTVSVISGYFSVNFEKSGFGKCSIILRSYRAGLEKQA